MAAAAGLSEGAEAERLVGEVPAAAGGELPVRASAGTRTQVNMLTLSLSFQSLIK